MAPSASDHGPDALLTPREVAALFRVTPKTVTRWAEAGKIPAIRTLGGHRRYPAAAIHELLDGTRTNEDGDNVA